MFTLKLFPRPKQFLLPVIAAAVLGLVAGCSVHEGRTDDGQKKVDIRTPFGELKVNTDVDAKDTGLPVYPGAQRIQSTDKDGANVIISSGMLGLKVVAIKFQSADPPEKVLAFYRPQMKAFGGKFLECDQQGFVTYSHSNDDDSKELTCDKGHGRGGPNVELKAGTPDRQHIVAVKPVGSGSEFALVYVSKHGKEGM